MRIGWLTAWLVAGCGSSAPATSAPVDGGSPAPMDSGGASAVSDSATAPTPPQDDGGVPGVYDATGPAEWTDGGFLSATYTRAADGSFTGAEGTQVVSCDPADSILVSECGCAVNGGTLVSSKVFAATDGGPANAWKCVGAPDVPAKGATIIAWIECRRAGI